MPSDANSSGRIESDSIFQTASGTVLLTLDSSTVLLIPALVFVHVCHVSRRYITTSPEKPYLIMWQQPDRVNVATDMPTYFKTIPRSSGPAFLPQSRPSSPSDHSLKISNTARQVIMSNSVPFKVQLSDDFLEETKSKLKAARFPGELDLASSETWSYGTPLATVKDLALYWRDSFDWRKVEARLNEMPQFTADVKGDGVESINVHFVHKRSSKANAIPLIFVHGWPGNFTEVEKILPLLTEPTDGGQAYHVVAPSLPGFVFSSAPTKPGFDVQSIATTLNQLMLDLGYQTYIGQGGDWGSFICRALAVHHKDHCCAIHVNMFVVPPPAMYNPIEVVKYLAGGYTALEIEQLKETQAFMDKETGYRTHFHPIAAALY